MKPLQKSFLKRFIGLCAFLAIPIIVHAQTAASAIRVKIVGLHSSKGKVEAWLWKSRDGFPKNASKALQHVVVPISGRTATASFVNVPDGDYAITAFHDENSNGKMDTNFVGIPKEGFGASNEARGRFGPPSFEAARFSVQGREVSLPITIRY